MVELQAPRKGPSILIRPLSDTELAPAFELLDAAYRQFAGPIDRRQLPRVGVPKDRLGNPLQYFLAEVENTPIGVAAFTVGGDVSEWALPAGPHAEAAAVELLQAGESWARKQGAGRLLFYMARGTLPTPEQVARLGFREVSPTKTVMQVVDFRGLLQQLAEVSQPALAPVAPRTIHLHLEPGLYPPLIDPDLTIEVTATGTRVIAGTAPSADVRIRTTATIYTEFLFGGRSFDELLAADLAVAPTSELPAARTVLTALTIGRPWFTPLGEHR